MLKPLLQILPSHCTSESEMMLGFSLPQMMWSDLRWAWCHLDVLSAEVSGAVILEFPGWRPHHHHRKWDGLPKQLLNNPRHRSNTWPVASKKRKKEKKNALKLASRSQHSWEHSYHLDTHTQSLRISAVHSSQAYIGEWNERLKYRNISSNFPNIA